MTTYRPTTLKLARRHCPKAVSYYEEGRPRFRDVFAVGIAAHAVLDHLGSLTIDKGSHLSEEEIRIGAQREAVRLIKTGRTFDGIQEPPLPHDDVFEGRDLAIQYAIRYPLSTTAKYELGVGFDRAWGLVGYGVEGARFRLILDVMDEHEDGDEDRMEKGIVVRDYKTAWNADVEELDTVQMKAQAVAASILAPTLGIDAAFIRQEVVNLRTCVTVARTIWLTEEGRAQLDGWQRDISASMEALDVNRETRPGHGCMGCPWTLSCAPAKEFLDDVLNSYAMHGELTAGQIGRAFAVAQAQRDDLFDLAKGASEERPIDIGGAIVGSIAKDATEPKDNALTIAWQAWGAAGGQIDGFVDAVKPGVTALEGLARRMRPRKKPEQAELIREWTEPTKKRAFGIYPGAHTEPTK